MFLCPPETGECSKCVICLEYILETLGDYDSNGDNFTCFACFATEIQSRLLR